ncbi:MAG: hypothetical protein RIG62_16255 [Cyclobacteriaceae bacterium]
MQDSKIHVGWLIGLCMLPLQVSAQVTVVSGVVALSSVDTQVSINATVNNKGKLLHQGTLSLTGDLLNQAIYQAEAGTLRLAGENQSLTSSLLKVGELKITNGYSKTLRGAFEVKNKLVLENGQLLVPRESQLILGEQAFVQNSSSNSYIQGFLYHRGTGEKFFPVGNESEYAPITLHRIEGDAPVVGVKYDPTSTQPYWNQRLLEGSYLGSTVTLSFLSQHPDYFYYPEQLEVQASTEQGGEGISLSARSSIINQPSIIISSEAPTNLPWLTVRFAVDNALEEVYVPNAFSPEAPDPNDQRIRVYGRFISLQNFRFGIQDAWGRWVYQTTSLEEAMVEGWPSTVPGSSFSQFRYILTGKFLSGASFQQSDLILKF